MKVARAVLRSMCLAGLLIGWAEMGSSKPSWHLVFAIGVFAGVTYLFLMIGEGVKWIPSREEAKQADVVTRPPAE